MDQLSFNDTGEHRKVLIKLRRIAIVYPRTSSQSLLRSDSSLIAIKNKLLSLQLKFRAAFGSCWIGAVFFFYYLMLIARSLALLVQKRLNFLGPRVKFCFRESLSLLCHRHSDEKLSSVWHWERRPECGTIGLSTLQIIEASEMLLLLSFASGNLTIAFQFTEWNKNIRWCASRKMSSMENWRELKTNKENKLMFIFKEIGLTKIVSI